MRTHVSLRLRRRDLNTLLPLKSRHTLGPGNGRGFDVTALPEFTTTTGRAGRLPRVKRLLQWLTLVLTVAASMLLAFLPVYSGATSDSNGTSTETSATLVQVNGPSVMVLLAIPIAISLLPLFARGRAWQPLSITAAILLGFAAFLGILSIGIFFVPAMIVEVAAAFLPTHATPRKAQSAAPSSP
jgi:hypothetical protein